MANSPWVTLGRDGWRNPKKPMLADPVRVRHQSGILHQDTAILNLADNTCVASLERRGAGDYHRHQFEPSLLMIARKTASGAM